MKTKNNVFFEYSKKIFLHWENFYGVLAFIFLVPSIISAIGIDVILPTWGWIVLLLTSFHLAGYKAYKEVFEKLPKPVDFSVECIETKVKPSAFNQHLPLSPIVYIQIEYSK